MKTALTIAGSDSSGGAGIQADIKTMTANGVYAMSAVTALTAQNTTGVYGILESTPEFLASQLDCIFTDIFPDAVKTGMVSSTGLIQVIADKLKQYQARNIVVDPVMIAASCSPWPPSSPPTSQRRRSCRASPSPVRRTWSGLPGRSGSGTAALCCARAGTT